MRGVTARRSGVAVARGAVFDLAERLDAALPVEARPGADLWIRAVDRLPRPAAPPLLPTADGWVHPGPATSWPTFVAMAVALGAPAPPTDDVFPDLRGLPAELLDAEAGAWHLPAVAVRSTPAQPSNLPTPPSSGATRGASVVVLGTAWAAPLVGLVLAEVGADVVRVDHPRRPDPFPLAARLARGQRRVALDLDVGPDRDRFAELLGSADLLVDGHTPRVRENAGLGDARLAAELPRLAVLRIAAFADEDRPGYGPAAESRGGWATRHDPPRLGRSSLADPVAGVIGALTAIELLGARLPGARARVSLEGAVGQLLDREAQGG
jgi:CoA-transferase family III